MRLGREQGFKASALVSGEPAADHVAVMGQMLGGFLARVNGSRPDYHEQV